MRGDVVLSVLEVLGGTVMGVGDIFEVILSAGYGASLGKLQYELSKKQRQREFVRSREHIKKNYYALVWKLRREGLVRSTKKRGFLAITKKGIEKLQLLRARKRRFAVAGTPSDVKIFTIVSFDIPEKEKRKRHWLRQVLQHLGLRMLQKSVWIGKVKLPHEFFEFLNSCNLLPHVEVFQITRGGTLQNIT